MYSDMESFEREMLQWIANTSREFEALEYKQQALYEATETIAPATSPEDGWQQIVDDQSGQHYWWNPATGESAWENPAESSSAGNKLLALFGKKKDMGNVVMQALKHRDSRSEFEAKEAGGGDEGTAQLETSGAEEQVEEVGTDGQDGPAAT